MTVISLPVPTPSVVVFGRDQAGKPHASWFDAASAELATRAAGLMNMRAVPVEGDALRELAVTLPRGRVFSSGKAFTPFINRKLYSRLVELTRDLLGMNADEAEPEPKQMAPERVERFVSREGDLEVVGEAAGGGAGGDEVGSGEVAAEGEAQPTPEGAPSQEAKPAVMRGKAPQHRTKPRPSRVEEIGMGSLVLASTGQAEGWYEAEVIGINGGMLTLKWRDYAEPTIVRRPEQLGFLPALVA